MKSFYKLIVSISCLFALSSCEGYLDVEQPLFILTRTIINAAGF